MRSRLGLEGGVDPVFVVGLKRGDCIYYALVDLERSFGGVNGF